MERPGERMFHDVALMARVMPLVWLAGSVVFLGVMLSGGLPAERLPGFIFLDVCGFTMATILTVGNTRLPDWAFEVAQYCGVAVVVGLVIVGDESSTPFALFFFWLAVQASFFGDWRRVLAQGLVCAAAYAGGLATTADGFDAVRWTMTVATLFVIGSVVAYMRGRVDALLARVNEAADTDELTGLGNRRLLLAELERAVRAASPEEPISVAMFDLDGFKGYNDAFGHPAGDLLLARVADRLAVAVADEGGAFRLGGDEFCVIARGDSDRRRELVEAAAEALTERGEGFEIGASCGVAVVPEEAESMAAALRLADRRLYQAKASGRVSGTKSLARMVESVSAGCWTSLVAPRLGSQLGLQGEDLEVLARAAQLHDIGKVAIPRELLDKAGPLTDEELDFIRRHVLIGERLLHGAAPLAPVARVVRATHERWDGGGYPDSLSGEEIPLPARIVGACDAYEAMTTAHGYRPSMSGPQALAELRRCAGTQFDPAVVEALEELLAEEPEFVEVATAAV